MKGEFFKFYSCCKIVVGSSRTAIYDLPRGNFFFLPNVVTEVFKEYEKKGIKSLFEDYSEQKEQLTKYFHYLLENEVIFLTDNPGNFPPIEIGLEKPFYLDFLTIEIMKLQKFKREFLQNSIDTTGVDHLILINSSNSIKNLEIVLNLVYRSRIKNITYISLYQENHLEFVNIIKSKHERLKKVIYYNSPNDLNDSENQIEFSSFDLNRFYNRRIETIDDFVLNESTFLESHNKNLYFNRRAFIENEGGVKPSYFHEIKYGNLKKDELRSIVLKPSFQKTWNINKDLIKVCKDCEFRYMCPDNRIPKEKDKEFYHDTICNYNPYNNAWSS